MWPVDDIVDAGKSIVDAVSNASEDAINAIEDEVIDPLVEVAEDIGEWIDEEIIERTGDAIKEFDDVLEEAAEKAQDEFMKLVEKAKDTWQDLERALENAWHDLTEGIEAAWDWMKDQVSSAAEWLSNAADAVFHMITEQIVPYIIDIVEFVVGVVVAIVALILLPVCALLKGLIGDDEAEVILGVAEHNPRVMDEFEVERRSSDKKYVVFSDVHMFTSHDLDFFNHNDNSAIYRDALTYYAARNYTLIENGDVEDFWMRDNQALGAITAISEQLPWPYYAGTFREQAVRSQLQSHALQVFFNNADTYALIRNKFHDNDRYVRTIGNHDDAWEDSDVKSVMQLIYPGLFVNDYCTLDGAGGRADVVLAHGHQSDVFNMPMCAWAGKTITNAAARLYELSFGEWNLFTRSKGDWMDEFNGLGFDNELVSRNIIKGVSFDEVGLYEDLEEIYGKSSSQPVLVLSHTHNIRDEAGVPNYMYSDEWTSKHYANTGTAGMWEDIVTGLEVEWPSVKAVAWLRQGGHVTRRELTSYQYGDYYLRPA